jgi:rRNA-processing protein FCF1
MTQGDGDGAVNGRPDADVTIIVDGANVVGSRPDGWWRDRAGAAVRLHDNLAQLAERGHPGLPAAELAASQPGATPSRPESRAEHRTEPQTGPPEPESDRLVPVTVLLVLEGAARAAVPRIAERARSAARTPVARGARAGSGDGEVQVVSAPGSGDDEIVRQAQRHAGHCIVVTADRELRRRCQAAGARVASPSWLYGLL